MDSQGLGTNLCGNFKPPRSFHCCETHIYIEQFSQSIPNFCWSRQTSVPTLYLVKVQVLTGSAKASCFLLAQGEPPHHSRGGANLSSPWLGQATQEQG